jgi:hypothetical protein
MSLENLFKKLNTKNTESTRRHILFRDYETGMPVVESIRTGERYVITWEDCVKIAKERGIG